MPRKEPMTWTEADWLNCSAPEPMLEFLRTSSDASERKLRLFACACARRVWHLLTNERSRACVAVAERIAEGAATKAERHEVARAAERARLDKYPVTTPTQQAWARMQGEEEATALVRLWASFNAASAAAEVCRRDALRAVSGAAGAAATAVWQATCVPKFDRPWERNRQAAVVWSRERRAQCHLLRDIFNPFRPVTFLPEWATPDVVSHARAIYDERAFGRMPELAAVLEEAGGREPGLLDHCRLRGRAHVRGCWAVDLLLGKG
jgi:hypothetical protein